MHMGNTQASMCMHVCTHTHIHTPVSSSIVLEVNSTHPAPLAQPRHLSKTLHGQPLGQERDQTGQFSSSIPGWEEEQTVGSSGQSSNIWLRALRTTLVVTAGKAYGKASHPWACNRGKAGGH